MNMEAYTGHPFKGEFTVRDGYRVYYSNIKMNLPVYWHPAGTRFDEASVNEMDKTVTFYNYYDNDQEYSTTLKLRDISPPIVWRMYPDFDFPF